MKTDLLAACLSGYYIGQVEEGPGPVLHLRDDGSFAWWQSDQAIASFLTGAWAIENGQIALQTHVPSQDATLFRLHRQAAWSSFDEQQRINRDYERVIAAVEARCPFATLLPPVVLSDPPSEPRPSPLATTEARQALWRWQSAKIEAERAAQRAVDATDETADALNEQAREALYQADQRAFDVAQSYNIAGLPHPRTNPPVLPKVCRLKGSPKADRIPQSKWRKGIKVHVTNEMFSSGVGDVLIRLEFSDGQLRSGKTDAGGLFYDPGIAGQTIVRISAEHSARQGRPTMVEPEPFEYGVVFFLADSNIIGGTRFSSLKMRRDGADLVSVEQIPMRYAPE
ncbi:MAG: hypothetical protein EDM03_08690 [Porphyrobacter sp. IPPAS B-1204]|nr:MAG: hypothetical protein EDM03_08690 [Porphyrobacter sp. IPPAS B-1204]